MNKKNAVLIIRSNDCHTDSRVMRTVGIYKSLGFKTILVGWDRLSVAQKTIGADDIILFKKNAGFGKGLAALSSFLGWFLFIFKTVILKSKQYSIIHACDFDTLAPTLPAHLMGKKIVYDIFDCFAESRKLPKALKKPLLLLEALLAKLAHLTILPDASRVHQLPLPLGRTLIIENVPAPPKELAFKKETPRSCNLRVAYVGTLTTERGLEELLDVVSKNKNILLEIAGLGELSELIQSYAQGNSNIIFYGLVSQEKGLEIVAAADLNYAMYYLGGQFNANHLLACPNKFYESLLTSTPVLTNKGTLFSQKVESLNVGFTLPQGKRALELFFNNSSNIGPQLENLQNNAKVQWASKYRSYYRKIIQDLEAELKIKSK